MPDLFEEFEDNFRDYDTANDAQLNQLRKQEHVDLRSFESHEIRVPINMLYLDLLSMLTMNLHTVGDLDGDISVRSGEQWTNTGTSVIVSRQGDRNNANGLSMACTTGDNSTASILRLPPLSD